jgi:Cu-Zn family superoxide dismutase
MKNTKFLLLVLPLAFGSLSSLSAMSDNHEHKHEMPASEASTSAIALIVPTAGNETAGYVMFEQVPEGIRVSGKITNLSPGNHGFHVHQYGDLSKDDGTSAGGHFNPVGKPHGGPADMMRHIGDLGNITANEAGVAEFSFVDHKLSFGGAASIIGRGLIVHAGEDDLTSQPTGAAGARVGMAVIGIAKPQE